MSISVVSRIGFFESSVFGMGWCGLLDGWSFGGMDSVDDGEASIPGSICIETMFFEARDAAVSDAHADIRENRVRELDTDMRLLVEIVTVAGGVDGGQSTLGTRFRPKIQLCGPRGARLPRSPHRVRRRSDVRARDPLPRTSICTQRGGVVVVRYSPWRACHATTSASAFAVFQEAKRS